MKFKKKLFQVIPLPDTGIAQAMDLAKEMIELGSVIFAGVADHTEACEAIPVDVLIIGIELFKVFFSSGVAGREVARPLTAGGKVACAVECGDILVK